MEHVTSSHHTDLERQQYQAQTDSSDLRKAIEEAMHTVRKQREALAQAQALAKDLQSDMATLLEVFSQIQSMTKGSLTKAISLLTKPGGIAKIVEPVGPILDKYSPKPKA